MFLPVFSVPSYREFINCVDQTTAIISLLAFSLWVTCHVKHLTFKLST